MLDNIAIWALLLASLVLSTVCTVMLKNLIKAAISLALVSAILTIILYLMGAALAAVLELSVCTGLITVVFASTISMTKPMNDQDQSLERKERLKRYIYLPFILVAVGIGILLVKPSLPITLSVAVADSDAAARALLWDSHQLDIFGQILVVLAGVFGVVVLFRTKAAKK